MISDDKSRQHLYLCDYFMWFQMYKAPFSMPLDKFWFQIEGPLYILRGPPFLNEGGPWPHFEIFQNEHCPYTTVTYDHIDVDDAQHMMTPDQMHHYL